MQAVKLLADAAYAIGPDHGKRFEQLIAGCDLTHKNTRIGDAGMVRRHIGIVAVLAAFGPPPVQSAAHCLATELAQGSGIFCASIDRLYQKIGAGRCTGITVPAINVRAIAFETARGIFRAMKALDVGATIFELSRGEIGFTGQRPHEYAAVIQCAAIAEGHQGPLFLQGDHFQISASRFARDPDAELSALKALIREAVSAGFYNIDIDSSTLVDLSQPTVELQQEPNIRLTAELTNFTRSIEPVGVTISIGGEIGEVGEENSTVQEVHAYLNGVSAGLADGCRMISKLSIQSGTRHGGNVLADGSFGDMQVEFELIAELTAACRSQFGLAGSVQHGASMLSVEKIKRLPGNGCIEVHLAAAFLNTVYEHLPRNLVQQADEWVKDNFAAEWKPQWSEAQFLHHARRYPIGPFKQHWWNAVEQHDLIREAVQNKAIAYFDALNVQNTYQMVCDTIAPHFVPRVVYESSGTAPNDESSIHDLAS